MAYCSNCGDEIAADANSCPACEAAFGPTSAWHPLVEAPAHRDLQRIANLRAATDRRRQKRERETQLAVKEPVEQGQHWFLVLLSWAGYLLEFASMLVQVIVVVFVRSHPGGGLGLVMLIYVSLFLVVPATLVAMGRAAAAFGRLDERSSLAPLAFHGTATLFPFAAYAILSE